MKVSGGKGSKKFGLKSYKISRNWSSCGF